jgi:hypothetical protein
MHQKVSRTMFRFHTALLKLGKAANSTEFSLAKYYSYLADSSKIIDEAVELKNWSNEIVRLAKLAVITENVELASLILIESLAAEFNAALDEEVELWQDDLESDIDDVGSEDFDLEYADDHREFTLEDLASIIEEALDEADEQFVIDDEFDSIIAANFDETSENAGEHADGECGCAECTAAADFAGEHADELTVIADLIRVLVKESFLTVNGKYAHPALRNDNAPEAYASQWVESFRTAAGESPYQLARFVAMLTELCDDTMFALIAKNSSSLDSYANASKSTLARTGSLLAVI